MSLEELEPEMETFLHQLIPNLDAQLKGATDGEIEKIEEIAGHPLPRFYRWFLMRMGSDMGPLSYPDLDFSASKIIDCYAQGLVARDPRFLLIGYSSEDDIPTHQFYDFDYPARDDARVTEGQDLDDEMDDQFETFREMIAWGKLEKHRLWKFPQQCEGFINDVVGDDILTQLDPLMESLGFKSPIPTGPCCALYDGVHAAITMTSNPSDYRPYRRYFSLAGNDAVSLRRLLGEITTGTSLEVEISKWLPPLG